MPPRVQTTEVDKMRKGNGLALREFRQIKSLLKERLRKGGSIQDIYEEFLKRELITMSRSSFYNHIHRLPLEQDCAEMSSKTEIEDTNEPQPTSVSRSSGLSGLFD